MPLILAIETATKLCSVALFQEGVLLAVQELDSDKNIHAEKVNVFIEEALREAGKGMKDLEAVAVGIGPGSYTGLRIGLSAAKGLCFALEIPIIGLSTLGTLWSQAKAQLPKGQHSAHPMVDARRMEVFTQAYDERGVAISEVGPVILDEQWDTPPAGVHVVFGDGADKAAEFWRERPSVIHVSGIRTSAAAMGTEAEKRFTAGAFDDLAYLVPTYGKKANVTQSKKLR